MLLEFAEVVAAAKMLHELSRVWNEASLNALEFENAEAFKNDIWHQQVMWSGFMTLQNPKENPKYYHEHDHIARFPGRGPEPGSRAHRNEGGFGLAIPKA